MFIARQCSWSFGHTFNTLMITGLTVHSVLFSILGLPLFGEKILRQAAASCFQLNMLYICVLYDNIEKKIWESLGKHVFPPFLIHFL